MVLPISIPSTLKELMSNDGPPRGAVLLDDVLDELRDVPEGGLLPVVPPVGMVPEKDVSVSESAPEAAETPVNDETFDTESSVSVALPGVVCRAFREIVRAVPFPELEPPKPKCWPPACGVDVLVIVMSVPTP